MSEIPPAPATDPDLGTNTPAYVKWALKYLTDDEFDVTFRGKTKERVAAIHGIGGKKKPAPVETPEPEAEPEAEPEKGFDPVEDDTPLDFDDQVAEDFANLHHATFKKKYGEDTYNQLKGAKDA